MILVTGSSGHLGEALMRVFSADGIEARGIDIKAGKFTDEVGSIADRDWVGHCMQGVTTVIHTATLHKPHVATHTRQEFIDTNITGTLNLLEAAVACDVGVFIMTSTTSTFGDAMRSVAGETAVWVSEDLVPKPKNIYGATKTAAEDLCALFSRNQGLACVILRTSRFFPEPDDNRAQRDRYDDDNLKVNELLFRRVDIQDVVDAHRLAVEKAKALRFARFIISATPPFLPSDLVRLGHDAASVVHDYVPEYQSVFTQLGWKMLPSIGRVYDNCRARESLDWQPQFTFSHAIEQLAAGRDYRSELTHAVGVKGYHDRVFADGPFPVEDTENLNPI